MNEWWRGAVIYQIYPRSFFDSNNDGIGDLPGITQRLDYIANLGVDAIWISPFFTSPMRDFGYDISDYTSVDPIFGDIDDFKALVTRAHELNIKVIIDQVISHSSDEHAWFKESRASKDNAKADWYVWADPQEDGSAPNNWLAFFGGSAWEFDSQRQQYYLHNFLTSQPDFNFHNADVRQAHLDNIEFWLKLGVDGFRLDVVNFYYHDKQLRDNFIFPEGERSTIGVDDANPYARHRHEFNITRPENLSFLAELRGLLDRYSVDAPRTTIGEINGEHAHEIMRSYTAGDEHLHMAYTFDLLGQFESHNQLRGLLEKNLDALQSGWPCWALSNHDVKRLATRWNNDQHIEAFTKVALAFGLCLRGSFCLYQGDELGFAESDVPFEKIVDPYGKVFWPEYKGRDGCRTPMAWSENPHGGFTTGEPWLPVNTKHVEINAESQANNASSLFNQVKSFLQWRSEHPALVGGDMELVYSSNVLCWKRYVKNKSIFVAFNLTENALIETIELNLVESLVGHGFTGKYENGQLTLPPFQAFFGVLTP